MFDFEEISGSVWEGRWLGVELLARALWANVLEHWWFGPLLLLVLLTATRKAWARLMRFIGSSFIRGYPGH